MAEPDTEVPAEDPPVRTILQVFYSAGCKACGDELQALAKVQEDNAVDLVIIVLGDRDKGYAELKKASPRLVEIATAASASAEADIMRAAGNPTGKLPYARTLLSTGPVCQTWQGGLTTGILDRMLESCRLKAEGLQGKPITN
jgi:hypothetical protein